MEFGEEQYGNSRNCSFFGNRIVELHEVTMLEKQQPERYGTMGYGGRQS